jgi:two-component system, cell cycle response regulator DivK
VSTWQEQETEAHLPDGPASSKHLRPRVLIVDDRGETREVYTWCMRAAGWVAKEVAHGERVIGVARAFDPDVIVVDLRLPATDAIETTRRLKGDEHTRHVPVVVCAETDSLLGDALAHEAGCDVFVPKPFEAEDLRVVLEEMAVRTR